MLNAGSDVDVANALWVAANTKKCPRCQTHIEKNEVRYILIFAEIIGIRI